MGTSCHCSASTITGLIFAWPAIWPEVTGIFTHLKEEGSDLFNERKVITFHCMIIRLPYEMCDDPFFRLKLFLSFLELL